MEDQISRAGALSEIGVVIWLVDLDERSTDRVVLDGILSQDERDRAARFVFEPDARRYRHCRAMLRIGLALFTGIPAGAISIQTTDRGKPFILHGGIHFNVSHCEGVGLLAFSQIGEIGVDVETIQPDLDDLEIASEHFTSKERNWIASANSKQEQAGRFTRIWTRKEAILKATGKGITEGLNSFDVSHSSRVVIESASRGILIRQVPFKVIDIEINESILAAVAGPDQEWTETLQKMTLMQGIRLLRERDLSQL